MLHECCDLASWKGAIAGTPHFQIDPVSLLSYNRFQLRIHDSNMRRMKEMANCVKKKKKKNAEKHISVKAKPVIRVVHVKSHQVYK